MNTLLPTSRRAWAVLSALVCALTIGLYFLLRPDPVQRLEPYIGRDLRTLSEDEQIDFDLLVGQLAPEARTFDPPAPPRGWDARAWVAHLRARPTASERTSWYCWRVSDGEGDERLVLFQGVEPLSSMNLSAPAARVFVLDKAGRKLTDSRLRRCGVLDVEDAGWLQDSGHGFPCLVVRSRPYNPYTEGADIAAQYYAFVGDDFSLVRLEDSAGKSAPVRHAYLARVGPRPPARTPERWEEALRSQDRAEVLGALVWLSTGRFDDAGAARATCSRPGVRAAVEALTRSEDRWVREAAEQAREAVYGGR